MWHSNRCGGALHAEVGHPIPNVAKQLQKLDYGAAASKSPSRGGECGWGGVLCSCVCVLGALETYSACCTFRNSGSVTFRECGISARGAE
jgi:hypothetical protein